MGSSSDALQKPAFVECGNFREALSEIAIISSPAAEDGEGLLLILAPTVGEYLEANAKDGSELLLPELLADVEELLPRSWEAFTNSVLDFALLDGELFCPPRDSCNCPALVQLLTSVVYNKFTI